ncbi:MAG: hypothetical protein ABSF74_06430 [Dehalococcoidia bacterium]|jgi:hypothetical protein
MSKISRYYKILGITLVLTIISISCSALTPSAQPISSEPVTGSGIKVLGIMGTIEIKPSSEDNLTCVTSVDSSDTSLKYIWSADNGTIRGEGKQIVWVAPDMPGKYTITVNVSNANGDKGTFSRPINVTTNPLNNETPDLTIYLKLTLPSTDIVKEARTVRVWTTQEIQCEVDNSNPANLTYSWTIPGGKLAGDGLSEGKAARVGWIAPGEAADYKVSVVVSDTFGNSARGEVDFNVYCCHPPE